MQTDKKLSTRQLATLKKIAACSDGRYFTSGRESREDAASLEELGLAKSRVERQSMGGLGTMEERVYSITPAGAAIVEEEGA